MSEVPWSLVAEWFHWDGGLLDLLVPDTTPADWQRMLDLLGSGVWPCEYDGLPQPFLRDATEIFAHSHETPPEVRIHPAHGVLVVLHFFAVDHLEMTLDPRELRGQEGLDLLCSFVRMIGTGLGKRVVLTLEDSPSRAFLTYSPEEDAFTVRKRPPSMDDTEALQLARRAADPAVLPELAAVAVAEEDCALSIHLLFDRPVPRTAPAAAAIARIEAELVRNLLWEPTSVSTTWSCGAR